MAFDDQRVKVASGLSIHSKQWVKAEQRAQLRGYPANGHLNDALDLLEEELLDSYAERRTTGDTPTTKVLRKLSLPTVEEKPAAGVKHLSFWDYYEEWVGLTRGHGKARSAMVYETIARHLHAIAAQAKLSVSFESITPAFGDKFTLYLLDKAKFTDNTIAKQVATLKRFMKYASDRGFHATRGWDWRLGLAADVRNVPFDALVMPAPDQTPTGKMAVRVMACIILADSA